MKIKSDIPRYVGGQRFEPDADGNVEVPDDLARAEGLLGAKAADPSDNPDFEALVDEAVRLEVPGPDGKKAPPSVLRKWAKDRLIEAIEARKVELAKPSAPTAAAPPAGAASAAANEQK